MTDCGYSGATNTFTITDNCADTIGEFIHFYPISSSNYVEMPPPDRKQIHRAIMRGVVAGKRSTRERSFKAPRQPKLHFVWKPQRF